MVEWSLAALRASEAVGPIVVACPPGQPLREANRGSSGGAMDERGAGDRLRVVEGGATRSQSVANALAAVETELVAIHDAARPLLTPELVEGVVATLAADPAADGAIAAAPVTDTIKRVADPPDTIKRVADPPSRMRPPFSSSGMQNGGSVIEGTVDRGGLWAAQTPQAFRTAALRRALEAYPEGVAEPTDEAMLVEAAGGRVLIHPSGAENLKVTTPLDLRLAELLLAERA